MPYICDEPDCPHNRGVVHHLILCPHAIVHDSCEEKTDKCPPCKEK